MDGELRRLGRTGSSRIVLLSLLSSWSSLDRLRPGDWDLMHQLDLEVVNVLCFQQMLEAIEEERWNEAAMALYKLYAIEEGERFSDLEVAPEVEMQYNAA